MDITYPAEAEAYRVTVRALLESKLPEGWRGIGALTETEQEEFLESWRKVLSDNGLLAVSWPEEFGGAGLSSIEQVVLNEELMRLGVPDGTENDTLGIKLLGNTITVLGTEEQKQYFLPRMLSGEHVWCQGYSEPEAGSDLAGMRTRAVLDGDEWVINGQKTWTSQGHNANWIFVVARTDPTVAKHKGLSFLLVPMDQPGVEVRPIINAAGYSAFSEVFFTDTRIPVTHVLGGVNEGWKTANTLLGFERGVRATTDAVRFGREVERLIELARERGLTADPRIRAELAWCWSRVQTMRFRGYRALTKLLNGGSYGVDGSFSKVIWSEFFQRLTEVGMQVLGLEVLTPTGGGNDGMLVTPNPGADNSSRCWTDIALYARAATIYGGSSQVQRNIIGEQLLGLPKEPRLDGGPFQEIGRRKSA